MAVAYMPPKVVVAKIVTVWPKMSSMPWVYQSHPQTLDLAFRQRNMYSN